jgi:oxygen-independent coproporphyrinogen-3 oxidase
MFNSGGCQATEGRTGGTVEVLIALRCIPRPSCYDIAMPADERLSLYIHIPFCTLKCSYCDFNSYAGIESLMRPFVDALCDEMRLWSPRMSDRRVATVFFGGGTPSLLPIDAVKQIMSAMRGAFEVDPAVEVSFEANPGTVDRDYLCRLRAAGVNRISFGVQSLHGDELRALDRIHSAEEAKEAYTWAREAGFERINLDLIYGLPEQAMGRWQATLEQAVALGPEHLSLYALTVEEGTKLAHDIERGKVPGPDGDMQAAMYEWSSERLDQAGYGQYEISNWSRLGEECRHNLVYWRNGEWLGLGPGAHSHVGGKMEDGRWKLGFRFADVYSPKQYIDRVKDMVNLSAVGCQPSSGDGLGAFLGDMRQVAFAEEQTLEMEMADTAILGLRLNNGLATAEFERRFERSLDEVYGPVLTEAVSLGLLERENGRLRLTQRGRLLANEVFVRLLAD